ncbi:hypothetical protein DMH04_03785 [Kibdelosporangium aridum]|uniref:Uncharacterized protein n=1 Tax=Kibdelosporangium aridum TaxID=2030 RepID=A0A428ZR98_KIBAR|nr:hypothetical protein [Kibdelosporangium aridum]RSM90594.1 hypothetical protein DMH04_03785 [Kibdelosporangium aridum]
MEKSPSPARRRLLIALAAAIVVVGAVVVLQLASSDDTSPTAAPPSTAVLHVGGSAEARAYACAASGVDADKTCERMAMDYMRRTQLTAQQRAEIADKSAEVRSLLPPLPSRAPTCPTPGGPCRMNAGPIDAEYVAKAWSTVFRAGYEDAVIRLARADDPAPPGTMVYGIPVGSGCVVGYRSDSGDSGNVAGVLPEGGCLAP